MMYCGQCGKRVLDDMLFCPFCGAPIVIPEQDAPAQPAGAGRAPEPERTEAPAAQAPEAVEPAPAVEAEPSPEPARAPEAEPAPEPEPEPGPELEFEPEPEPEAEPEPRLEERRPFEPLFFDEAEPAPRGRPEAEPARPASLFDEADGLDGDEADGLDGDSGMDEEAFAPLELDDAAGEPEAELSGEEAEDDFAESEPLRVEPRRRPPTKRRAPLGGGRSVSQTFIPVRDVDPDDMFMDHSRPSPREEYDPYDDGDARSDGFDEEFSFEEPEPASFLQRHIRGAVGLLLLAALLAVILVWAAMPNGQRVLARANLAWSARVYNDMGYEAYEAGQYPLAARYFERALARDDDNYDYAHSAMVAYYEAEDAQSALAMLKRCIDMNPDNPEPYAELLILYPDAATRPWDAEQLLRQGYERTGEPSLNVAGE